MATDPVPPEAVHIAVLAKAPLAGLAKTRLIPALGARGAARLQRRFTLQALHTARLADLGEVTLWCAPDTSHRFFRALQRRCGIDCRNQPDTDLGQRMLLALCAREAQPCIVIGTDCPALTPAHLQGAADALRSGQDAVFIPAEDGGYVLIGLRRPVPDLFESIDWSTERVMAQTRERLRSAGASWQETALLWDVDVPADLARLSGLSGWMAA
jgi:rSAM/selenodomain-associated transferase 1